MTPRPGAATFGIVLVLASMGYGGLVEPAAAQPDRRYSFALRNVALSQALDQFARTVGVNVAYMPALVDGERVFCTIDEAEPEEVMRCILRETGLDYYLLSSGTYVIVRHVEEPPLYGSVRGHVVDRASGLPLPDAYIHLREVGVGTFSNEAGHFLFSDLRHGPYLASISHLGYRSRVDTLWIEPETVARVTVALQPVPVQMEPVVIDGFLQQRPSRQLGAGTVDESVLLQPPTPGAASVLHALDLVPGVRLDETTAGIQVQEGAPGEHQLLLDGAPVFQPIQAHRFIGMFSPFALKRLTVHKAGYGARYGSYTSGVVRADHKLQPAHGGRLDLQVDPLSAHAYARHEWSPAQHQRLYAMTALRTSLWTWYQPPPLSSLLDQWSHPDYFLVDAPLFLRDPDRLASNPPRDDVPSTPSLRFLDLHAAFRWQLGPWHSVEASLYRSNNAFANDAEAAGLTTVADRYTWVNQTGQVRLNTILGARLLGSLQLRTSRYSLSHHYQLIDSLRVIYNGPIFIGTREIVETPIEDGNEIHEVAAEIALDYAAGQRHDLEAGVEAAYTESRFEIVAANALAYVHEVLHWPRIDTLAAQRRQVAHRQTSGRVAGFLSDRITLSAQATVEAGARITWLPHHRRGYVEPRLAVRYDADARWGTWAARAALGLYRQFTHQFDVSSANVGALLPSVRFWAPVDASVRPAKAYHVAGDVLVQTRAGWEARLETFLKLHPRTLSLLYAPPDTTSALTLSSAQHDFLETGRGYAWGLTAALTSVQGPLRIQAEASWSRARQRSPSRFGNRYVPMPWHEPLRVQAIAQWQTEHGVGASLRGRAVGGRAWGFRQAYYDYLASHDRTRTFGSVDLGQPEHHRLPPLLQVDAGVHYARRLGPLRLLLRADVLNVLNRANVAEWRLHFNREQQTFIQTEQTFLPRTLLVTLRATW